MREPRGVLVVATLVLMISGLASAQGVSRDEALASTYPGASVKTEQLFLTAAQQKMIADLGGSATSAFVVRYVATKDGQTIGRAYVDTHTVRTKKESLLIMLDALGRVKRVEVTAFLEPAEFHAPEAWLRQYKDRTLAPDLDLNRAIRPIAGATLTAKATNAAVRRILAVDHVMQSAETGSRK